jgi:hypothetical protein
MLAVAREMTTGQNSGAFYSGGVFHLFEPAAEGKAAGPFSVNIISITRTKPFQFRTPAIPIPTALQRASALQVEQAAVFALLI